jgi:hypothetical protein
MQKKRMKPIGKSRLHMRNGGEITWWLTDVKMDFKPSPQLTLCKITIHISGPLKECR